MVQRYHQESIVCVATHEERKNNQQTHQSFGFDENRDSAKFNKGVSFDTGDILTIILNTKEQTIGVMKNDEKDIHIIWQNIPIEIDMKYTRILKHLTFMDLCDFLKRFSAHIRQH